MPPHVQEKSKLEVQLKQLVSQMQLVEKSQDKKENQELKKRESIMIVGGAGVRWHEAREGGGVCRQPPAHSCLSHNQCAMEAHMHACTCIHTHSHECSSSSRSSSNTQVNTQMHTRAHAHTHPKQNLNKSKEVLSTTEEKLKGTMQELQKSNADFAAKREECQV